MLKLLELTDQTAPQVRDLMYKVFGYSHSGKHLYNPAELMARYRQGLFIPMMVADAKTEELLGYFDMGFPFGGREVAWFGCLALDPSLNEMTRLAVLNTLLRDCIDKVGISFKEDGLRLVITTDTVDHTLSQRLSGQFGLKSVGLLYATVPEGGHLFHGGYRPQGTVHDAGPHRRPEVLSVYPAYRFIQAYESYLPPQYAEQLLPIYEDLELPVSFAASPADEISGDTQLSEYPDLVRGIVTLEVNEIGLDATELLNNRIDHFRTGFIPVIHVLVPLYPRDPGPLLQQLEGLGGVFGGIFPRYKGRDMLVIQMLDKNLRRADETRVMEPAARRVVQDSGEGR